MLNPLDCACCGDELVWADVPAIDARSGAKTMQRLAFDPSGMPHAPRCTDSPFGQPDRAFALYLAREVQRDVEAVA